MSGLVYGSCMQLALVHYDCPLCGLQHPRCDEAMHLMFHLFSDIPDKMYQCGWLLLSQLQNYSHWAWSPSLRCWTRCTWYGYMPSSCNVQHTLISETWKCMEILAALTPRLYCTTWMFSCSATWRCTGCSVNIQMLGNEPLSCSLWKTLLNTRQSGILWLGKCRYCNTIFWHFSFHHLPLPNVLSVVQ